jgi:phosphonate transport system ATP-binding protein
MTLALGLRPMIHLRDIAVVYCNGLEALHGVSLAFTPGQFTVLLGPSGAGKSTLLRCLNLLVRPTRGQVVVDGLGELAGGRTLRAHRRRTGMVFQHHHLIGRQTALQNVLMGRLGYHSAWRTLFPLPAAEQRIGLECLERVGLLGKALERAEHLSGGERQRVGIARALAQQPRLVLADEPVASLDPATARQVLGLLRRVCAEDRLTAVISLHQVELARDYADRVVGIRQGRLVFDGPPGRLPDALAAIYPTLEPGERGAARANGAALLTPLPSPSEPRR